MGGTYLRTGSVLLGAISSVLLEVFSDPPI